MAKSPEFLPGGQSAKKKLPVEFCTGWRRNTDKQRKKTNKWFEIQTETVYLHAGKNSNKKEFQLWKTLQVERLNKFRIGDKVKVTDMTRFGSAVWTVKKVTLKPNTTDQLWYVLETNIGTNWKQKKITTAECAEKYIIRKSNFCKKATSKKAAPKKAAPKKAAPKKAAPNSMLKFFETKIHEEFKKQGFSDDEKVEYRDEEFKKQGFKKPKIKSDVRSLAAAKLAKVFNEEHKDTRKATANIQRFWSESQWWVSEQIEYCKKPTSKKAAPKDSKLTQVINFVKAHAARGNLIRHTTCNAARKNVGKKPEKGTPVLKFVRKYNKMLKALTEWAKHCDLDTNDDKFSAVEFNKAWKARACN